MCYQAGLTWLLENLKLNQYLEKCFLKWSRMLSFFMIITSGTMNPNHKVDEYSFAMKTWNNFLSFETYSFIKNNCFDALQCIKIIFYIFFFYFSFSLFFQCVIWILIFLNSLPPSSKVLRGLIQTHNLRFCWRKLAN